MEFEIAIRIIGCFVTCIVYLACLGACFNTKENGLLVKRRKKMELESVSKLIGCLVISIIIFAIPCLATLAFALNWEVFIKYLLTMFFISEVVTMAVCLYGSVD